MHFHIHTYSEAEQFLYGFAEGKCDFLIIIGPAGIQKSVLTEKTCGGARLLSGTVTPFELYRELYRHRDRDFVIDDVDEIYRDKAAVRLLKNLCDSRTTKIVQWRSAARELVKEGIPTEFVTKTRVVLIANEWKNLNKNVGSLEDRGLVLHFTPTAAEVHRRVGYWFKDEEIYPFIGSNLQLIIEPSMRTYHKAMELRAMGVDWRAALLKSWSSDAYTVEVVKLLNTPGLTQEERAQQFTARTGGCRATFFNIQRRLGQPGND